MWTSGKSTPSLWGACMGSLVQRDVADKSITMAPSAWGPGIEGRSGDRQFLWSVGGRAVSRRYRATRHVVFTTINGESYRTLVDGVGGVLTSKADRGHGYGSALMTASMRASQQEGYALGMLFCLPSLVRWYQHLGWWMTRGLSATYHSSRGPASVSVPDLWVGLMALSPAPSFSSLSLVEIEGRLW